MDMESVGKVGAGSNSVKVENTSASVYVESAQQNKLADKKATKTEKGNQENGEQKREYAPSEATISDSVSRANRHMDRTRCEYSYHEKTKRVSIKVFDDETGEVIREIPPEKSLDMLQKMWEMAGILVDEKR